MRLESPRVLAVDMAGLLELDNESGAVRLVVGFGVLEPNHRIQHVLAFRCSALLAALAIVMDKQHGNAPASHAKCPLLDGDPSLRIVLSTPAAYQRGDVVDDD